MTTKKPRSAFRVDSRGGRVTTLQDAAGGDILFPLTTINGKLRGGSHVCLPQFGPDAASGELPQHGYGRDVEWSIDRESAHAVELVMNGGPSEYADLQAALRYTIEHDAVGQEWFAMELRVQNGGTAPLRVSPGFHPYFATGGHDVWLNGEKLDVDHLGDAVFLHDYTHHELTIGDRTIVVESRNLPTWAVWTDNPEQYICLEPTAAGNSFLESTNYQHELIAPGEERRYTTRLRTQPRNMHV